MAKTFGGATSRPGWPSSPSEPIVLQEVKGMCHEDCTRVILVPKNGQGLALENVFPVGEPRRQCGIISCGIGQLYIVQCINQRP